MVDFAAYIEEKWDLSYEVAEEICRHFEGGSSKFFVNDYVPTVSTQVDIDTLSEVFGFLNKQKSLESSRDRARSVLQKTGLLDSLLEDKIVLSVTEAEIEDLYIAFRTNVRTKGQIAISKGLKPLADKIDLQEEQFDLDAEINALVGTEETLATADDVISGIKDILAEIYGYEEAARIMLREYGEDEGCIELHFKKKTKKYDEYRDGGIPLENISDRDILKLRDGEIKDEIKLKITLPPFQVMELLKEHFVEDHSCTGYSLILEALEDAWVRLLHPMVETSIKEMLYEEALAHIVSGVKRDLRPMVEASAQTAKFSVLIVSCGSEEQLDLLVLDNQGNLLRATQEEIREFGRPFTSKKIKQLFDSCHPVQIAILENDNTEFASSVVEQSVQVLVSAPEVVHVSNAPKLVRSAYLKENSDGLSEEAVKCYAAGLSLLKPFGIIASIGVDHFNLHDDEKLVGTSIMSEIVDELYTTGSLKYGVEIGKKKDSLLLSLGLQEKELDALRIAKRMGKLVSKKSIQDVEGISQASYQNIAGYVVVPTSQEILDKSTVHPAEFSLVDSVCEELNLDLDQLLRDLAKIEQFEAENESVQQFIRENISSQLRVALRYQSLSDRPRKKLRLRDLEVDAVVEGRVTNITGFGAFVDINAFSDGLVHISELASDYVESPDQVVKVGDLVKVKVIEINRKKKRISLSMKQADNSTVKVRASRAQLNDLAQFFNN